MVARLAFDSAYSSIATGLERPRFKTAGFPGRRCPFQHALARRVFVFKRLNRRPSAQFKILTI